MGTQIHENRGVSEVRGNPGSFFRLDFLTGRASLRRWIRGRNVFLLAFLAVGFPIGREQTISLPQGAVDTHFRLLEQIGSTSFEQNILLIVVWGGLYLAAFAILLPEIPQVSSVLSWNWAFIILLFILPMSVFWTENFEQVIVNSARAVGVTSICLAGSIHYRSRPRSLARDLGLLLGGILMVHVLFIYLNPLLGLNYEGRWRGLFANPNFLGQIAYCAVWANAASIIVGRRKLQWGNLFFAGLSLIVLLKTGSATSMVATAVAVGCTLILAALVKNKPVKRAHYRTNIFLGVFGFSMVLLLFFAPLIEIAVAMFFHKPLNLTGRTVLWAVAADLIQHRPFLGWSFDSHLTAISVTGLPTVNFHNGFLDLAVSGGVISILLLAVATITAYKNLSLSTSNMIIIMVPFFISTIVYNLSEVTFFAHGHPNWIIFILMLFVTAPLIHRKNPFSGNAETK